MTLLAVASMKGAALIAVLLLVYVLTANVAGTDGAILTPTQARASAGELITEAEGIAALAKKEDRERTAEELTRIDECLAEDRRLRADAESEERVASQTADLEAARQALNAPIARRAPAADPLGDIRIVDPAAGYRHGDPTTALSPMPLRPLAELPADFAQVGAPGFMADPRRGFEDMGQMAMVVHAAALSPGQVDNRLLAIGHFEAEAAASGLSAGVPSDGGFLLAPQFSQTIWQGMMLDPENLISLCDVYTVTGESLELLASAETSRADGSRWGGIRGYWKGEIDQMQSSKPTWRRLRLEPEELYVFSYVTDKLTRYNPVALNQWLTRAAISEINFKVNGGIVEGVGAGMPLGYMKAGSLVSVPKEAAQVADTIVAANVNNIWARCHAKWRRSAVWFINQDVEPQLETLAADVGTGGVPLYYGPGGIREFPDGRLKSRPVRVSEFSETLGDKGDIALAALGAYALGLRGSIASAMSIHFRFDTAENAFRWIWEADGQPWPNKPLTPYKGANTLSPFVTLDERA